MLQSTEQAGPQVDVKRRAACDECRVKKLKCLGETPSCSRCVREGIECVYSPQKPMGRPKKRRQMEDEDGRVTGVPYSNHAAFDETSRNASSSTREGLRVDDMSANYFDSGAYETTFTPGGSLQPWLQQTSWPILEPVDAQRRTASEIAIPALTPDSSSTSPTLLDISPELQSTTHVHDTYDHYRSNGAMSTLAYPAIGTTLDPLMPCATASLPTCACLSTMYLSLNNLQSMDPAFPFPFALHPLREAMETASNAIKCKECPKRFITGIQNVHLLGTILLSIAERFSKLLAALTAESVRAAEARENKKFRLADLNNSISHLHTGGLGCVATFSVELSPKEWRVMCKKVVKAEVYGPVDGNECCPYFVGICSDMRKRQEHWHRMPCPEDFPVDKDGRLLGPRRQVVGEDGKEKADHLCMKLVEFAEGLVREFDWS